jgi:NitT/TauT family transport system ATP-binding protein
MTDFEHITVSVLSKRFRSKGRDLLVLADVSLGVAPGEFVSVIGPSGCGKTTLLRIIGGLLDPDAGEIMVRGAPPRDAQRRKDIGFVFQDPSLLPWRSVLDNVRFPLQVNRGSSASGSRTPEELVETVGLTEFARYFPHELSGGMKQRVALARALVFDPALLLMDEPLGSLDELTRQAMRYELLKLWEATRQTVVMVTHSIAEAVLLSDRVVVMTGLPGRINGAVDIDLPRPREAGIERSEAFLDYGDRIQRLLATGGPVGATAA